MKRVKETKLRLKRKESNIIGHLCYAAFKLWKESYSSSCSPLSPLVSKEYAAKENREKRGLYVDGENKWNADSVGAYNILRLYGQMRNKEIHMEPIKTPYVVKVAV